MRRRIFKDPLWGQTELFNLPAAPAEAAHSNDARADEETATAPNAGASPSPLRSGETARPIPAAQQEMREVMEIAAEECKTDHDATLEYETDDMALLDDDVEALEDERELEPGALSATLNAKAVEESKQADGSAETAQITKPARYDNGGARWSGMRGLPPLVTGTPPRRRPPDEFGADDGAAGDEPRRRRGLVIRRPRRSGLRAMMVAALLMIAIAGTAAIVYRFASNDPDYDRILAILQGDGKGGAAQAPKPAEVIPDFRWPCAGEISSLYGERVHPKNGRRSMHTGIDIAAPYYEVVFAAADGLVTWAAPNGGKGNMVVLRHSGGYESQYFHLQKIKVKKGERVTKGDLIAWVGSTGYSTGPHLHLEIHRRGEPVDPATLLPPPSEDRLVRLKRDGVDYPMGGN